MNVLLSQIFSLARRLTISPSKNGVTVGFVRESEFAKAYDALNEIYSYGGGKNLAPLLGYLYQKSNSDRNWNYNAHNYQAKNCWDVMRPQTVGCLNQ